MVELAEMKGDEKLLVRVRGCDLFASEAHFHPNCRKKYIIDQQKTEKVLTVRLNYTKKN